MKKIFGLSAVSGLVVAAIAFFAVAPAFARELSTTILPGAVIDPSGGPLTNNAKEDNGKSGTTQMNADWKAAITNALASGEITVQQAMGMSTAGFSHTVAKPAGHTYGSGGGHSGGGRY